MLRAHMHVASSRGQMLAQRRRTQLVGVDYRSQLSTEATQKIACCQPPINNLLSVHLSVQVIADITNLA